MSHSEILAKASEYVKNETDEFFRSQVKDLIAANNSDELNDRFYKDLDFGTGGMRGEIGGGLNRMNPYMIQKATQGLANYVKKAKPKNASAVIAYDSRNFSELFALEAALVLAANGIKTYLFSALRPTPELSFAVRYLKATTGIVITASHNPKEYNGYKAYWDDGGQVIPPHDKGIIAEVRAVTKINRLEKDEALAKGLLKIIDKEVDVSFIQMIKDVAIRPELIHEKGKTLKVVYTPLHGTGAFPVSTALKEMGIDVIFVPEQKEPDGNFPTVDFPNPEMAPAMELSLKLGKKVKADIIMGTDPDADRLGIAVPEGDEFILITGNQLGALLADYMFSSLKETGKLPKKPLLIKTIVTTEFQRLIAESYGALCVDVLTGFKYIGEKIREYESQPNGPNYVVGGEESYGYLVHTHARDKDAVSAATMCAEMALYHKSQGRSLMDQLRNLWQKHGYFEEILISSYFKGQAGGETMDRMMQNLRGEPPKKFAGERVLRMKDYKSGTTTDIPSGKSKKDIDLPSSNVLQFFLQDGAVVTARPSGTEPKIKFYASMCTAPGTPLSEAKSLVAEKAKKIRAEIDGLIQKAQRS